MAYSEIEIFTAELFTHANGSMMQAIWYLTSDLDEIADYLLHSYATWDYAIVTDTDDANAWCITRTSFSSATIDKIPF